MEKVTAIIWMITNLLVNRDEEDWECVLEGFFTYLAEGNMGFGASLANAVEDYVYISLSDDGKPVNGAVIASVYEAYADQFEEIVKEHIMHKVYHSSLCKVC